jgi:hypothetical protein
MRATISIALVLALAAIAVAQDKDKDKNKKDAANPGTIRVCVAEVQNTSRRSVNVGLMRDRLLKDLKDSKAPKKAQDQRRIAAIPLESGGGEGDAQCDFTLYANVIELRQKDDPLWQQERDQGIGTMPSPGSRHEEVTYGEVRFKLRSGGSFSPVVDETFTREETTDENGVVGVLMDRVAQRVNSAVRETAGAMRE